ncbi:MAG: 23S rRNA (cytidine(2498)-2'-O)-methyltransferase RlmM [Alteromonadaceae bacterium]|jgi:23S rRNA (cytidine2498-2'-O)-methyltransferase|nr:23S rRNA (cytidine(2498)-2'-O)-methyltransferase RlmM [Alteromonadaceae bacterium]
MAGLALYCRTGFEKDLANEVIEKCAELNVYGYPELKTNSGLVLFHCYQAEDADRLAKTLPLTTLIFARQLFAFSERCEQLDTSDRIGPILNGCIEFPECGELRVEHADSTDGREISKFCRKISVPLRQALRGKRILTPLERSNLPVCHVYFEDSVTAIVGYSYPANNSPYPLGILRLKFPNEAPSRSTLKLDEAFQLFIPKKEHAKRLSGGLHAVDLGACPGGWTYQLVKRGMFVEAVDNGAMDEALMATGQVRYCPEDGFKFQPRKNNVYWLVCDMIEQPQRVAKLMATWIATKRCQETVFNLKLPMKKRYESVKEALEIIDQCIDQHRAGPYDLKVKHLYHDREEVTVHMRLNT